MTEPDEVNGQTEGIVLSRFQRIGDEIGEKLVVLKFITKEYLELDPKRKENLQHEQESLIKCVGQEWCMQLIEKIELEDCVVFVTELILGFTLYNAKEAPNLNESVCRKFIMQITEAIAGLHHEDRNIIHRDLHLRNVMIHFPGIEITKEHL